jgi:hypothetical protein
MLRERKLWFYIGNKKKIGSSSSVELIKSIDPIVIVEIPQEWNVSTFHVKKSLKKKRNQIMHLIHIAEKNKLKWYYSNSIKPEISKEIKMPENQSIDELFTNLQ